ncbi:MAG: bifunctional UDP-N-acetylglucosamine diphosphorylase/glucosamine-1-phosphate N-acetyltransferase GlmU [Rhodobacteraceae bacterium]|nr:bifunctional UDP-N-acetylglucosamine diphosphorylase/glucosamine-1-phosphate N-acetyltransferase GlmU [Paracoccaceae bacterium]
MKIATILLAAGEGNRMRANIPKVLCPLGGVPLYVHAIDTVSELKASHRIAVLGYKSELVQQSFAEFGLDFRFAEQRKRLGTAHAVSVALKELTDFEGQALVMYGDTPFLTTGTVKSLIDAARDASGVAVLGFETENPVRYGRLVVGADGGLERIVEHKDATSSERSIKLCNSGILCASVDLLRLLLPRIKPSNAAAEYYLTDIVGIARARGIRCVIVKCHEDEAIGVNSASELAHAESVFQRGARRRALAAGAMLKAPESVVFSFDTRVADGATIGPNVVFGADVNVANGAHIRAFSHLEGCSVGENAVVGPYARIRPGTIIGPSSRIGNFVEIKASTIGQGTKIQHLSYVGDATIGDRTNVGAGTVFCNYDGERKHRTRVGNEVFIGSGTMLVAPLTIGDGAITAAGSVITDDVPDNSLSIARSRQANKPDYADRLKRLRTAGNR